MATNALSQYLPYPQVDVFAAEILGVISSFKLESGIKSVIRLIFQKSGKILLLFLLQHSLRNMDSSMGFAKGVLRALFYKSVSFDMSNVTNLFISKLLDISELLNTFPLSIPDFTLNLLKKQTMLSASGIKRLLIRRAFTLGNQGKQSLFQKIFFHRQILL